MEIKEEEESSITIKLKENLALQLLGKEFEMYYGKEMIDCCFKIIKNNPLNDFWKTPENKFLFEEIVEMCEREGYQLILHKKLESNNGVLKNKNDMGTHTTKKG